MRPIDDLTRSGQRRRLARLAASVLDSAYGLHPVSVRPIAAHSFNTVFRVDTRGGRLALRVGDAQQIHPAGVEDVEAAWLDVLAQDAPGLAASTIIRDAGGRSWVPGADPDVPATRTCTLFTWARGVPLRDRLSADGMRAAGRLLGRLHEHAAGVTTIVVPNGLRADRVVYFEDATRLSGWQSPHGSLFLEAMARAQVTIDGLWASPPHRPHLLHGDLGPQNVMTWRDQVRVIDFQDLQLGFDVQDVGLSVADIGRHEPGLLEPFRAGYADVRRWPLDDPALAATLAACRSLNLINLGLNLRRPGLDRFLADHAARVREWMRTPA